MSNFRWKVYTQWRTQVSTIHLIIIGSKLVVMAQIILLNYVPAAHWSWAQQHNVKAATHRSAKTSSNKQIHEKEAKGTWIKFLKSQIFIFMVLFRIGIITSERLKDEVVASYVDITRLSKPWWHFIRGCMFSVCLPLPSFPADNVRTSWKVIVTW